MTSKSLVLVLSAVALALVATATVVYAAGNMGVMGNMMRGGFGGNTNHGMSEEQCQNMMQGGMQNMSAEECESTMGTMHNDNHHSSMMGNSDHDSMMNNGGCH